MGARARALQPGVSTALVLWCAATLLTSSTCSAQKVNPLAGQGAPNLEAASGELKEWVEQNGVSVTVDANVVKLLEVSDTKYTFSANIDFNITWVDPDSALMSGFWDNSEEEPETCGRPCVHYGDPEKSRSKTKEKCCDRIWIPEFSIRNLVSLSSDRVAFDRIAALQWSRQKPGGGPRQRVFKRLGCVREVRVVGTFAVPLHLRSFPFDRQRLVVQIQPSPKYSFRTSTHYNGTLSDELTYRIVPGATYRMADVALTRGNELVPETSDQLPGWNINNVTFSCSLVPSEIGVSYIQGQRFQDPAPTTFELALFSKQKFGPYQRVGGANYVSQFCALSIDVARQSRTATVTIVVPVVFISLFSFVAVFLPPDDIEVRLTTEVTLFLSLTALQFVFRSMFPLTSYVTKLDAFITLTYCLILCLVVESLAVFYISKWYDHKRKKGSVWSFGRFEGDAETGAGETKDVELGRGSSPGASEREKMTAFRVACQVNIIVGVILIVGYVVSGIIILRVAWA